MAGGSQLHDEDGSDKITFRLSTHLKEQYKEEVDNMSADLEAYVRERVGQPDDTGGVEPWKEPEERDLAIAYRTLCDARSPSGIVRGEKAKRALAQAVEHVGQDDAMHLLHRLAKRGYVRLQNGIPPSDMLAVHVRPFSKAAKTDADDGGAARAD